MSIEAMNLVLNHSKAQGRAKLVLLGIANHLGDNGAWPSIQTLARYANASERSVKRDIQELITLGELTVEKNASPVGGQYKTNLYWITLTAGVTDWVSRGDRLGKSGVTTAGTLTINRTIKEPTTRASRISDDFEVTPEMRNWANENHPGVDVDKSTANFIDYWVTKPSNATKLDWGRTWKVWIRNSKPERATQNRQTQKANNLAQTIAWAEKMDQNESIRNNPNRELPFGN